jgi:hypothetical protein
MTLLPRRLAFVILMSAVTAACGGPDPPGSARVSSFGEDAGGELYLTDLASGTVYRVVRGG